MFQSLHKAFHGPKIYKLNDLQSFDEACKVLPKTLEAGNNTFGTIVSTALCTAFGGVAGMMAGKDSFLSSIAGFGVGALYNYAVYKIDSYGAMKPKQLIYIQDNMIKFCVATPEIDSKDDCVFDNKYYLKYTFDVQAETNNVEIHVYD